MSEGKYPRMPKPKDRSKRHIALDIGEVELKPTTSVEFGELELEPDRDKAAEYKEETGDEYEEPKRRPRAPDSMVARLKKAAGNLSAQASKPWARFLRDDDDE